MKSYFRKLDKSDITDVLNLDLRQIDKDEAKAMSGISPDIVLLQTIAESEIKYVVIHKDKIEGVFGLVLGDRYSIPWFVATDKFKEFKFSFAKESKALAKEMYALSNGVLQNYISTQNKDSIKWLEWLGFKINYNKKYYFYDKEHPFYKFRMKE